MKVIMKWFTLYGIVFPPYSCQDRVEGDIVSLALCSNEYKDSVFLSSTNGRTVTTGLFAAGVRPVLRVEDVLHLK